MTSQTAPNESDTGLDTDSDLVSPDVAAAAPSVAAPDSPLMAHIRYLAEKIGPRGSTTEAEHEAAEYVSDQLAQLGLEGKIELFQSATSAYSPYAIASLIMLVGLWMFWQPQATVGAVAALVLSGVFFAALLLEMQFKDNLLRWVQSRGDSANVVARLPAAPESASSESAVGASGAPIVITAHLDTHRTPWLFSSSSALKVFQNLLPAGLLAMAVLLLLYFIGIFVEGHWLRQLALLPGAVVLLVLLLMWQANLTAYTPGANDNASGVAVALELAQRLRQQPLQHHEVHLVFTGCEEVACYGADAYFKRHRAELINAMHLVIDQVGDKQADPYFTRSERFLVTAASDPGLLKIADQVIADHPELRAHSAHNKLAYSELSVGARYGLRVIGLGGAAPGGEPPQTWHRLSDTVENVSAEAVARAADAAWQLLQGIDHAAS